MNVLIYDGLGTSKLSLRSAHASLTGLLSPYYSVRYISAAALLSEPWTSTTALLVIPGGRDLPYCAALDGDVTRKIDDYVRRGGKYLGFCAGAYFASARVEFEVGSEIEVQGPRQLSLWAGTARGCAFPRFVYDSEAGARAAKVKIIDTVKDAFSKLEIKDEINARPLDIYWNGGGIFVDAQNTSRVTIVAEYEETVKVEGGAAAVISVKHGNGRAVLSAVHPEISLKSVKHSNATRTGLKDTSSSALDPSVPAFTPSSELRAIQLQQTSDRVSLLKTILRALDLTMNASLQKLPKLSTMYLLSYSDRTRLQVVEVLKSLMEKTSDATQLIKSNTDTFMLLNDASKRPEVVGDIEDEIPLNDDEPKYICLDRHTPDFPLFDPARFFAFLHRLHYASQPLSKTYEDPSFGTSILYGEIVTSSQSLLDNNTSLSSKLPNGFTILCSHQLAGRGRGQNSWISPPGVLSFSSILHHTPAKGESPGSIVLIQYLVSLAVTEAIRKVRPRLNVRIKWPNDIYLEIESHTTSAGPSFTVGGKKFAKISGSLITTSWSEGKYVMVVGIGINLSNPHPTISINTVLPESEALSLEELFATVLTTFSSIYQDFVSTGASFTHFEKRYYALWLHNEQKVTIDATSDEGTVCGINCKDGTLRVLTKRGEIGLQADGNSFDMLRGLIKVKS